MNDRRKSRLSTLSFLLSFFLPIVGLFAGWIGWDLKTGALVERPAGKLDGGLEDRLHASPAFFVGLARFRSRAAVAIPRVGGDRRHDRSHTHL